MGATTKVGRDRRHAERVGYAPLRARGVTAPDLQTSGLVLYENTNNRGAVTGVTVSDNINVTMHDIDRAGAAVASAVHAVGNGVEFSGVSFSPSNDAWYLAAARALAMRNARRAASQIAAGGGARLGAIEKITDQENATPAVDPVVTLHAAVLASGVPLAPGGQSVSVRVSVVYALNAWVVPGSAASAGRGRRRHSSPRRSPARRMRWATVDVQPV